MEEPLPVITKAPERAPTIESLKVMLVAPLTVKNKPYTLIGPMVGVAMIVLSPLELKLSATLLVAERCGATYFSIPKPMSCVTKLCAPEAM
jgi:hypothetical protein